jgi:Concanavalin A-like lectin/glucanases superfamily
MTRCLLGFVLLAVVSTAQVGEPPCTPPPSGMTAWYTGDGTANDFLAKNNGTLQNGAGFASGLVAQAFSLNGTNQFVSLPANVIPYPAAGATSNQPISVDAWFSTTSGGVILGQQGIAIPPAAPSGDVPAIYVGTDGFLYAELFWKGSVVPISSAPVKVNNGAFHLVAVTYDGATEAVYLDGALLGSAAFTQVGYAASYQYQIGTGFTANWPAGNGGYFYFQGLIDEVEIFNRALYPSEIHAIFTAGSAGKCKVTSGVCISPPAGMTSWYTGDGTAHDFLGKNNGELHGDVDFASGVVGQAFSLNGTNQFVSLPANVIPYPATGATSTQPMSVDAWFSTTSGGVILGQQGLVAPPTSPSAGFVPAIYVGTDGYLYAELFWKGTLPPISSAPIKVNNGAFHLVAVTYDGNTNTEAVYLDGALIGSSTNFTQVGYAASYQYQIGTGFTASWPAGNGGYFYFQGLIDEVEIFNRALASSEIQALFTAGSAGKCKNQAPVARCQNVTVAACMANASIDDGSFDPDGDPVILSQIPPGPYSAGTTPVTLTVTDNHGTSSQCTATVTVIPTGTGPATITSLTATPNVLWPPNHKLVPVTVTENGNCGAVTCKIVSVTSNEPLAPWDYKITGNLTVELRASRLGRGNGRVYTITVHCTDAAGNVVTKTVTVTVPHDMGNGGDDNNQGGDNGGGGDQGNQGNGNGNGNGHGRGRPGR